jgi:hypothetical protein
VIGAMSASEGVDKEQMLHGALLIDDPFLRAAASEQILHRLGL